MAGLLPVEEAQQRLFALGTPVAAETVGLAAAAGRWAACDIAALRSQPAQDLSAMDGYAIRFADLPGPFTLIGESAAGHGFAGAVGTGETVRIFTGAAMPAGSDTVLVQEESSRDGTRIILAGDGPSAPGRNVRHKGLDFSDDDLLVTRGARLTPARIALAAIAGHGTLLVNRRVRVTILTTGDELVPPGAPVGAGQVPEANGVMLAAHLGGLPVDLSLPAILPDQLDLISGAIATIDADIIVTIGGASVGDHDLIRPAIEAAGGTIDFWRIALRPGKPMLAGRIGSTVILGLPGNPVSAFVTAHLFLRPLIATLAGAANPLPRTTMAMLGEPLPANDQRQDYLRARWATGRVISAAKQDSSLLQTLAQADCLIVRPPFAPAAEPGEMVPILPLA